MQNFCLHLEKLATVTKTIPVNVDDSHFTDTTFKKKKKKKNVCMIECI